MACLPKRKSPRSYWIDYNYGAFFVTVCTKDKKHYFGHITTNNEINEMLYSTIGQRLEQELSSSDIRHPSIEIPCHIVMPNHFHAIILINDKERFNDNPTIEDRLISRQSPILSNFIGRIKSAVSKFAHEKGYSFEWQKSFHDHAIRDMDDWNRIAEYIENNVNVWEQHDERYEYKSDMNINGIIFDYGGTIDSRGDHWSEIIFRAYVSEGAETDRDSFRKAYVYAERALDGSGIITPDDDFHMTMRKKVSIQFRYLGIDAPSLADAIATRCYEHARENVADSREALSTLAERYPLGIVSNFYGNLRCVLRDFGILHLFRTVVDSTEAGIRKPDPKIFLKAIADMEGCDMPAAVSAGPKYLVVGDSVKNDIIPADSIGCFTALIPGTPWDADRAQPVIPDRTVTIHSLQELPEILPEM